MRIHRLFLLCFTLALSACGGSTSELSAPQFELRGFAVTEERKEATEYSKAMNTYTGKGTLVARNVDKSRNLFAFLEVRDETKGPDAEPEIMFLLVRGGIAKVEITKSKYGQISPAPKYTWAVIGWTELAKATIELPSSGGT